MARCPSCGNDPGGVIRCDRCGALLTGDAPAGVATTLDRTETADAPDEHNVRQTLDSCRTAVERFEYVPLRTMGGRAACIRGLVFSPDGHSLVAAGDRTIRVWDVRSGQRLRSLRGHGHYVAAVALSPDGAPRRLIASGSYDTTVKVWDAESGRCVLTLAGHSDIVTSVVFSPDGSRVASGSGDGTIRLWDAATGECLGTLGADPPRSRPWLPRSPGLTMAVSLPATATAR